MKVYQEATTDGELVTTVAVCYTGGFTATVAILVPRQFFARGGKQSVAARD